MRTHPDPIHPTQYTLPNTPYPALQVGAMAEATPQRRARSFWTSRHTGALMWR